MNGLLEEFIRRSAEILKDNLCGIYLHGSAVMGCFHPETSDIDLIVVVNGPVSDDTKLVYMAMVTELNTAAPPKGIEMSVVTRCVCRPFVYPTPFELHFSPAHLDRYRNDPDLYVRTMRGTDRDLAAHFTVIRARGRCLYGLPAGDVFGEVPERDYLDSIWYDVAGAREEIAGNTAYLVLNLARVLAYCREGSVLSKQEGGEWALACLPEEFHSLVRDALKEYAEGGRGGYDVECAGRYADYMLERITRERESRA